jgi:predicted ester cyclase
MIAPVSQSQLLDGCTRVEGRNAAAHLDDIGTGEGATSDGDKLVKHWEFKGKHTGTFFGIPATGKDVDLFGVTIVKMKGGKIAEEQDFMDNLEFMQQLGLMPR